jgi:hypothetical protein
MQQYTPFLIKMIHPLVENTNDLRTTIAREVCKTICLMTETLNDKIEQNIHAFLQSDQCLFKMMESGNGVLAEFAHNSILSVIYNLGNAK